MKAILKFFIARLDTLALYQETLQARKLQRERIALVRRLIHQLPPLTLRERMKASWWRWYTDNVWYHLHKLKQRQRRGGK